MAILHEVQNSADHKESPAMETSSSLKIASWNLWLSFTEHLSFPYLSWDHDSKSVIAGYDQL